MILSFDRRRIMRAFLATNLTTAALAREAGVAFHSARAAVSGKKISLPVMRKVAHALNVDPAEYLAEPTPNTTVNFGEDAITISDAAQD